MANYYKSTPELAYHLHHPLMERICARAGGDPDTWYATNIEIYNYLTALWQLRFTAERDAVYNPTCLDLWIEVDRKPVMLPAGKVTRLDTNEA